MYSGIILLVCIFLFASQLILNKKLLSINYYMAFQFYYIVLLPFNLFIAQNYEIEDFYYLNKSLSEDSFLIIGLLILVPYLLLILSFNSINNSYISFGFEKRKFRRKNIVNILSLCIILFGYLSFLMLMVFNGGFDNFIENRELWRSGGLIGQGIFTMPSTFGLFLGCAIFILNNCQSKYINTIFFIMLLLAIVPPILQGFRSSVVIPIIQLSILYHYRVRILKLKNLIIIFLGFSSFYFLYGNYRQLGSIENFIYSISDYSNWDFKFMLDGILRTKGADSFALVYFDGNDLFRGDFFISSIFEAITILIPHMIWAEKPLPVGVVNGNNYFGFPGIPFTILGESYINGGIIGICFIMLALGFFMRISLNYFVKFKDNNLVLMFYIIIFPLMVASAESLQFGFNNMVINLTFFYIISKLISSRNVK